MPECTHPHPTPPPPTHKCFAPYSFPFLCCRFSKSQKSSINTGAFVPFGSGPRYCIGMRLAAMEAKMTLIEVLSKFRIVKAPETKVIELYVAYTQLTVQTFIHMLSQTCILVRVVNTRSYMHIHYSVSAHQYAEKCSKMAWHLDASSRILQDTVDYPAWDLVITAARVCVFLSLFHVNLLLSVLTSPFPILVICPSCTLTTINSSAVPGWDGFMCLFVLPL